MIVYILSLLLSQFLLAASSPAVFLSLFSMSVSPSNICVLRWKIRTTSGLKKKKKKLSRWFRWLLTPFFQVLHFLKYHFDLLFHQFSERQYYIKNGSMVQGNFWTWQPSKTEFEICPKLLKLPNSLCFNFLICGMEIFYVMLLLWRLMRGKTPAHHTWPMLN